MEIYAIFLSGHISLEFVTTLKIEKYQ